MLRYFLVEFLEIDLHIIPSSVKAEDQHLKSDIIFVDEVDNVEHLAQVQLYV